MYSPVEQVGVNPLSRRRAIRAVGATLVGGTAGTAGCTARTVDPSPVSEGFEFGLDGWTRDAHVGPEADTFEWSIARSGERARTGEWSLAVFTEGRHDDGTAWIVRPVGVDSGTRYRATGRVYYWSARESFNTVRNAVCYLGPTPPETEEDFPAPGTSPASGPIGGLRAPLDRDAGWSAYGFEWRSPPVESDRLYLAVGVSVVWEADRTVFLDDVSLDLVPV